MKQIKDEGEKIGQRGLPQSIQTELENAAPESIKNDKGFGNNNLHTIWSVAACYGYRTALERQSPFNAPEVKENEIRQNMIYTALPMAEVTDMEENEKRLKSQPAPEKTADEKTYDVVGGGRLKQTPAMRDAGWIDRIYVPMYDGPYLCYINEEQECGTIWGFQKIIECKMAKWVVTVKQRVVWWRDLYDEPRILIDPTFKDKEKDFIKCHRPPRHDKGKEYASQSPFIDALEELEKKIKQRYVRNRDAYASKIYLEILEDFKKTKATLNNKSDKKEEQ